MKKVLFGIFIALALWFLMFSPATKDYANFWVLMIISATILITYSVIFGKEQLKRLFQFNLKWVFLGIISAILLYLIFYIGFITSNFIFDFTKNQVSNIYSIKEQGNKLYIALALLLWIGPAEEIFWRGFVQHNLANKFGETKAFILATFVYTFVHIWAFNFMLFMAALVCGIFWGLMFMKNKSLVPIIISHSLWDVLIFVILPIL